MTTSEQNIITSKPQTTDMYISQKELFRLASLIYAESTNVMSTTDVQLYIVKCIISQNNNSFLNNDEILAKILELYHYSLSEEELERLIKTSDKVFETTVIDERRYVKLVDGEYLKINSFLEKTIDYYIDQYIQFFHILDADVCRDAIYCYLYELTTSNINSYKVLLFGESGSKFSDADLSVNLDNLNDHEKILVRNFLDWDCNEKNIVLSNIVFSCLEYCLLVSGDKPSALISKVLRNREIYLDTNIVFRALGINGASRKSVVEAFLSKCKQAQIKIVISYLTKKEFFDTITHYITQIVLYPRGKAYLGAYEALCDLNLFSFYESWLNDHESLSLNYFKTYITVLYNKFIQDFKIVDGEWIENSIYRSSDYTQRRDSYAYSIQSTKNALKGSYISEDTWYSQQEKHDASLITYVEELRKKCSSDTDIFCVSSDKALRLWDMTRDFNGYPVVVYPSQLFLVLIRICGRADDDFKSFVSFINIRTNSHQLSPTKANAIISGISSITNDMNAQEGIIAAVFEDDFQNIIRKSNTDMDLYTNTQLYCQKYLELELAAKSNEIITTQQESEGKDIRIAELIDNLQKEERDYLEQETQRAKKIHEDEELRRERICRYAGNKVAPSLYLQWYIVPIALVLYAIIVIGFIFLQFAFRGAAWNYAEIIFNFVSKTLFGSFDGFNIAIDTAALASIGILFRCFWKNPFNKEKLRERKMKKIEKYITKNDLN